MNAPKKAAEDKEPEAVRYDQADNRPTSPAPSIGDATKPVEVEPREGGAGPAVMDSDRIDNPIGLKAERAAAAEGDEAYADDE